MDFRKSIYFNHARANPFNNICYGYRGMKCFYVESIPEHLDLQPLRKIDTMQGQHRSRLTGVRVPLAPHWPRTGPEYWILIGCFPDSTFSASGERQTPVLAGQIIMEHGQGLARRHCAINRLWLVWVVSVSHDNARRCPNVVSMLAQLGQH